MGEDEYLAFLKKMVKDSVRDKPDGEYELRFFIKVRDKEINELSFEKDIFFSSIDRAAGFTTPGRSDKDKNK